MRCIPYCDEWAVLLKGRANRVRLTRVHDTDIPMTMTLSSIRAPRTCLSLYETACAVLIAQRHFLQRLPPLSTAPQPFSRVSLAWSNLPLNDAPYVRPSQQEPMSFHFIYNFRANPGICTSFPPALKSMGRS